jgi:hypothetical protein
MSRPTNRLALLALPALLACGNAHALFRAYVASTGNDANPCTVAQPCRLLPAALSAVDVGGEVWMLDSANFNVGRVDIGKSVSILAVPGAVGSIVGNGDNAISVNAGANEVALRNLKIVRLAGASSTYGISVNGGTGLVVDHCEIAGFQGAGVIVNVVTSVAIVDSVVRNNGGYGAMFSLGSGTIARSTFVKNTLAGAYASGIATRVSVTDSVASHNGPAGFLVANNAALTVAHSIASSNTGAGFKAETNGVLSVSSVTATNNGYAGIWNSAAVTTVSASTASANTDYGLRNSAGTLRSAGNNVLNDNVFGETFGTISAAGVQ